MLSFSNKSIDNIFNPRPIICRWNIPGHFIHFKWCWISQKGKHEQNIKWDFLHLNPFSMILLYQSKCEFFEASIWSINCMSKSKVNGFAIHNRTSIFLRNTKKIERFYRGIENNFSEENRIFYILCFLFAFCVKFFIFIIKIVKFIPTVSVSFTLNDL